MELAQITRALQQDAVTVVFINVLLQQIGLPVPAMPTLLLAGSLAATPSGLGRVLAAALVASVIADWLWFWSGRLFGYRVLAGLCKLSINPSSCVSQTEARFVRWGLPSLVVAKFIPGFSTVAPPIAGALRMSQPKFLLASAAGAALWAGVALGAGWFMQETVKATIALLDEHSGTAMVLALVLVGGWLGWKLWQKFRFRQLSAIPHITANELLSALAADHAPRVLDLRGAVMVAETPPIPGATHTTLERLPMAVAVWPKDSPIVTLCACPQDASAIHAARQLLDAGYLSVRPLKGGYAAWVAAQPEPAAGRAAA
ncbi:MAG: VTT domain-containing protein [Rhodoferax sp.]|uniref:VTT domain-containing protein n=1 Tax=Rhodoferax sp. TaxID=50421 RepID=UPI003265660A